MTRTIEYTDSFKPAKYSEVIEEVFYDVQRQELYVKLHTGVVAGYAGVPSVRYREFRDANSAGQFWNFYIKGVYGTLNGDVNFVPFERGQAKTADAGKQSFSVVVDIKGDLKFDIESDDVATAVRKVEELVSKTLVDGIFFVKEVKFNQ